MQRSSNHDRSVSNGTGSPSYPATVPGQIHTDLLAAGAIPDPYVAWGVEDLAWVALGDWTYRASFAVPASVLARDAVRLVARGLDTVGTLSLNGRAALSFDNMFRTYRVDVKHLLVAAPANNTITVAFRSKPRVANASYAACLPATSQICPQKLTTPAQHGFDNANYMRTEPCSFSWDWGPGFAPVGIWRALFVRAFDGAVVRDVTVVTTPRASGQHAGNSDGDGGGEGDPTTKNASVSEAAMIARAFRRTDGALDLGTWDATFTVYVFAAAPLQNATVRVALGNATGIGRTRGVALAGGAETEVNVTVRGVAAAAWWPNGHGAQPLYTATADVVADGAGDGGAAPGGGRPAAARPYHRGATGDAPLPAEDGSKTIRFGFRTVTLEQPPLPGGRAFFFRFNGVPIVVKGSNWIPADAFESRLSRAKLAPHFAALAASHQNMIRNWGGGIWQRDSFYDLADEHGIAIWNDAVFACAQYAVPPAFLASSAQEVRDNVRRLQAHPSIAIWAGNNENEKDLTPATAPLEKPYSDLYFRTVLANVTSIDASRPVTGSSPSDGNETAAAPFPVDHQSEFFGDVHCYLYDADNWDTTVYKKPRFMSEFGLQSWPSALTMRRFFPPGDQCWGSALMADRNHHPAGQDEILQQIAMHYHLPQHSNKARCGTSDGFRAWRYYLYLSQVNQAYGYKTEVEHFRRLRTTCSEAVPGCTMGMMYWQTNDIWPGASWAAIDWTGRFKMVQHFTGRFYAPFLVSPLAVHGVTFETWVVNDPVDAAARVASGRLEFTMWSWWAGRLRSWAAPFAAAPASAARAYNATFDEMLALGGCKDPTECVLTVAAYNGTGAGAPLLSRNYLFLSPFYDVTTAKCTNPKTWLCSNIVLTSVAAAASPAGAFDVTFSVDAVTPFLWLETEFAGRFSDNGLLVTALAPETTTVQFYPAEAGVTAAGLKESLEKGTSASGGYYGAGMWSLFDTSPQYRGSSNEG